MAHWVVLISALMGCAGIRVRSIIQAVVVIWSLKTNKKDDRRHARKVLKILQDDQFTVVDRLRDAYRRLLGPGEIPDRSDTNADEAVC